MTDLSKDPVPNAIYGGICEDVQFVFAHERFRAGVMLVYAGMDTMASLDRPANKDEVSKVDFIQWVNRYIRFPCVQQLTGEDLYSARCAMLHTYGAVSKLSRSGACRMVGYVSPRTQADRYQSRR